MVKWAFLGAKEQGGLILKTLIRAGYRPSLVVTLSGLPPRESDEFRLVARKLRIPFAFEEELVRYGPLLAQLDVALVCRFSLLPEAVFSLPRLGSVNMHNSLLPLYRGVHPVQWAIVNGERKTGVTVNCIDAGIDTGPILMQKALRIRKTHDFNSLSRDLNTLSSGMCCDLFKYLGTHEELPRARKPTGRSSYARRRTEEDSRINWHASSKDIANLVRAMQGPMPSAFSQLPDGRTFRIMNCVPLAKGGRQYAPGTVVRHLRKNCYWIGCGDGIVSVHATPRLPSGTVLTSTVTGVKPVFRSYTVPTAAQGPSGFEKHGGSPEQRTWLPTFDQ